MSGRHSKCFPDERRIETCDCDIGQYHLDDGTPVRDYSRWMDRHILVMQDDPAMVARIFDWRGGPPT